MQITLDDELCALINGLRLLDWHETYACAIKKGDNSQVNAVLAVSGSLRKHFQEVAAIQIDYWSISDLLAQLLSFLAHGFSVDSSSNRYIIALLTAIKLHGEDRYNVTWITWEAS